MVDTKSNNPVPNFYRASAEDFKKIPGSPIAYWVSEKIRELFSNSDKFESQFNIKAGISTGKNEDFIFFWQEVNFDLIRKNDSQMNYYYTPHNKGGDYRKWIGNYDSILKYSSHHIQEMQRNPGFRHDGKEYYFNEHIGWSKITSSDSSFRLYPNMFTFDSAGLALFSKGSYSLFNALCFLNSKISIAIIRLLNPTLNVTPQILKRMPLVQIPFEIKNKLHNLLVVSKQDWDSYETSWDFTTLPLISPEYLSPTIEASYQKLRSH